MCASQRDGSVPVTTNLFLKSVSDGPNDPERSRGSPLIALKVVAVRARQHPKEVLSDALLYVYDASIRASRGNVNVASAIAARSVASPSLAEAQVQGGNTSACGARTIRRPLSPAAYR